MQSQSAPTHYTPETVLNQSTPLQDYNLYTQDVALQEAVRREGGAWIEAKARELGALLGRQETLYLGELANRHTPVLYTHDRFGHRRDEVEYHPAYHELMRLGVSYATHAMPWREARPGSQVARGALMMLRHQVDEGTSCPLTMTFAVVPTLRIQPNLATQWEPRVLSTTYDPRYLPLTEKEGALFGMAMTERQGGSDVRANISWAVPEGPRGPGQSYRITGHKWFCSAPMCDAFLTLAQTEAGLSCFLLPRWTPDGAHNGFRIIRLKDKLGNRSNASSEVEFHNAWAQLVGEEGRGVATIMEMVRHTRLDCALGSAATLRRAVAEALHHAGWREAFGRRLIDQPLMANVLADLAVEYEAAVALAMRLARSFDAAENDEAEKLFSRIVTPVAKYWITKRAIAVTTEALECLGGNGYVEETPLARLFRDVPVNSVWEGAGNIQALDLLRAMRKEPAAMEVVIDELRQARGQQPLYDAHLANVEQELHSGAVSEAGARRLAEGVALAIQAALLIQHAPEAVATAFCAGRLGEGRRFGFGGLPDGTPFGAILARAWPA
ncbi:MAG: acyl-CoA dehydrogenase family protein [Caldilineaceae bacterium]|nr:acyl-CoA dehydrogenase family protein [Caldilineaceae bacterium]